MENIAANLQKGRESIRTACQKTGRELATVRLLAVSKGQGPDKILEASDQGQEDFGENYVQEWRSKMEALDQGSGSLAAKLRWHFIGHLQSNKVKEVVGQVELIHTVDTLGLAQKISSRAAERGIKQKILLEVQLVEEANKSGWDPRELMENLPALSQLPKLEIGGLMAIPPPNEDPEASSPHFARLKSLLYEINRLEVFNAELKELSMGMSHDYAIAIEEGATLIRIGTAIFGSRL